ncbi:uncharacterized protein LOC105421921 [Amborella trichopoda]|uniref:uncharacterized protein LOC105421921 n=1 Tax=Amborella trichopoda TaxID=13333 RepID=UPI0005D3B1CE|nr:uncharacterized protein LOC105421921 [Amborella trichopoda]|eukprot:XP_011629340.1 uncharacterized protein LOC105421921 [Amborella trichopoda]
MGNHGNAGVGGVVQDWTESIILFYAGPIGWATANMAEFTTLLKGSLFIKALNLGHFIVVEGDSLNAIKWCNKELRVPWMLRSIWGQVLDLEGLLLISCQHVFRESNGIVDGLTKRGVSMDSISILNDVNTE